jgi:cytoskeleton protein RodZ
VKKGPHNAMDLFGEKPREGETHDASSEPVAGDTAGERAREHEPVGTGSGDSSPRNGSKHPFEGKPGAPADQSAYLRSEETIGEMLLAARERLGQTLEYMSQETKIPKPMLQYLETDNYEALPAKVYARSFLRTYATALGLDAQHLLSKFEVHTGQTHRSKGDHWEIESEIVEERIRSPLILKRVIIPAVIGIALIIVLVKFAGKREHRVEPVAPPSLMEEILSRKPGRQPEQSPKSEQAEPQSGAEPMELHVASNPTDSCWFELVTVSVVEQQPETTTTKFTLLPGQSRTFEATEEFFFKKVGNAGGFVMELNGSKLPTLGKKGKVITNYKITRENLPKDKKKE